MKSKSAFFKKNQLASLALVLVVVLIGSTVALAADGNLDPTFGTNGIRITDLGSNSDSGNSVLLQPDGKIIMLASSQGQSPILMRFNSNGSIDNTFGAAGKLSVTFGDKVARQSDGKLIVGSTSGGSFAVARYDKNGKGLDTTFGTNGVAKFPGDPDDFFYEFHDFAIQPDNKIVVIGTQRTGGHTTTIWVVRFTSSGEPDNSFEDNGFRFLDEFDFPNSAYFNGKAVAIHPDGKILLSGDMYDSGAEHKQIALARLLSNGFLDTEDFGTNGKGTVATTLDRFENVNGGLALQADGKILVVGSIFDYGQDPNDDLAVARFTTAGSLDPTFGGSGIIVTDLGNSENANAVVIQPDGKIVLVGNSVGAAGSDILLVRYNSNGSLDNTFGVNGKVITDLGNTPDSGNRIAIQTDGKLVVAGSSNGNALLARYTKDFSDIPQTSVTFRSTSARDGWILESTESSNTGGTLNRVATTLNVGDNAKDRQYRSILSFNTVSIPDNAIVTAAELRVRKQGLVGSNPFASHGALLVDIKDSAFSGNLTLQLNDFKAAAAGRESIPGTGPSWYSVKLKATNLTFINKYGVTQFRLRFSKDDDDDLSADYIKFFSGEAIDANRPKLIITYFVP